MASLHAKSRQLPLEGSAVYTTRKDRCIYLFNHESIYECVNLAAVDRMANCLRVLGSSESTPQSFQDVWLKVCRQSFAGMIKDKLSRTAEELKKEVHTFSFPCCSTP